jgi:DNA (cytosine-5)-methyltransferase 1
MTLNKSNTITNSCKVVDLFCGVGGLTHGFVKEGFNVVAGFDIDTSCRYAYEANNNAIFKDTDVTDIKKEDLEELFEGAAIKILVGCAPCQPFSSYNFKNDDSKKWFLLHQFARLIEEIQPDIVSMENVPQLLNFKKAYIFQDFLAILYKNDYKVDYGIVDCPKYGIPQKRKRLVLLASKLGKIKIIEETHKNKEDFITVKDAIGHLAPIEHGETFPNDPLHRAAKLTPLNLQRVQQSKPGGTWLDWDENLRLECHKKASGQSYRSIYGRMSWNEPSPTMTTQCNGLGNGRFGHPDQDRAISLREAALLQTFPVSYKFISKENIVGTNKIAMHIGNAVPVKLGEVIAKSIKKHLSSINK